MQEVNVWYSSRGLGFTPVRLTRGEALDAGGGVNGACPGTLHYEGNLDELLKEHSVVYRFCVGELCSHFYFSVEEVYARVKECFYEEHSPANLETCEIKPARYKPVELPVTVDMWSGEKGPFCRMNLHPEIDGQFCRGKIYFVDRNCADKICEGPAIITSVKDKGSYGFVTGYMKQYQDPTDAQVADYVIKNNLYEEIVQFCNNKFGSFVLLYGKCFIQEGGAMYQSDLYLPGYDDDFTVTESLSGADLVCQGYQGCSYEEFKAKFVRFEFEGMQPAKCSRFVSELFDEAIKYGFISHRVVCNVEYVVVNEKELPNALDQFSQEEMNSIIKVVYKINTGANEAIKAKIKSGKVTLLKKV